MASSSTLFAISDSTLASFFLLLNLPFRLLWHFFLCSFWICLLGSSGTSLTDSESTLFWLGDIPYRDFLRCFIFLSIFIDDRISNLRFVSSPSVFLWLSLCVSERGNSDSLYLPLKVLTLAVPTSNLLFTSSELCSTIAGGSSWIYSWFLGQDGWTIKRHPTTTDTK